MTLNNVRNAPGLRLLGLVRADRELVLHLGIFTLTSILLQCVSFFFMSTFLPCLSEPLPASGWNPHWPSEFMPRFFVLAAALVVLVVLQIVFFYCDEDVESVDYAALNVFAFPLAALLYHWQIASLTLGMLVTVIVGGFAVYVRYKYYGESLLAKVVWPGLLVPVGVYAAYYHGFLAAQSVVGSFSALFIGCFMVAISLCDDAMKLREHYNQRRRSGV